MPEAKNAVGRTDPRSPVRWVTVALQGPMPMGGAATSERAPVRAHRSSSLLAMVSLQTYGCAGHTAVKVQPEHVKNTSRTDASRRARSPPSTTALPRVRAYPTVRMDDVEDAEDAAQPSPE